MYKVFFKDRTVYLEDDFSRAFTNTKGLIFRFGTARSLQRLVDAFFTMDQVRTLCLIHEDLKRLTEEFRACFTLLEAGGGVVLNSDRAFLAIKRNGVWDLPKGKLKEGEDYETAALREVGEETGLEPLMLASPITSTYHTYRLKDQNILKKTEWYEMHYNGNEEPVLQAEEGITDYRWVAPGSAGFIRHNTYLSIMEVLSALKLL